MYSTHGLVRKAQDLYYSLKVEPDTHTLGIMMEMYALHGMERDGFDLFRQQCRTNNSPEFFNSAFKLIAAYGRLDLLRQGHPLPSPLLLLQ